METPDLHLDGAYGPLSDIFLYDITEYEEDHSGRYGTYRWRPLTDDPASALWYWALTTSAAQNGPFASRDLADQDARRALSLG